MEGFFDAGRKKMFVGCKIKKYERHCYKKKKKFGLKKKLQHKLKEMSESSRNRINRCGILYDYEMKEKQINTRTIKRNLRKVKL